MILGLISEEVVESSCQLYGFVEALHHRQLPHGVGRIFNADCTLAHIVVVLVFHILHAGKHSALQAYVQTVMFTELVVVVYSGVKGVLACRNILVTPVRDKK